MRRLHGIDGDNRLSDSGSESLELAAFAAVLFLAYMAANCYSIYEFAAYLGVPPGHRRGVHPGPQILIGLFLFGYFLAEPAKNSRRGGPLASSSEVRRTPR